MSHPAPWRLLVHASGRGDGDPKFTLCSVAAPGDVRPAAPGATVDEVTTQWVAERHGLAHILLTPLPGASCWRVDEGGSHGEAQTPPAGSGVTTLRQRPVSEGLGRGAVLSR